MNQAQPTTTRYKALTERTVSRSPFWEKLDPELQEAVRVVSKVLPFRVNEYVVSELIDWDRVPDDPMYQLTFPQRQMLDPEDYETIRELLRREAPRDELEAAVHRIRLGLNPHPAGQLTHNVPTLDGRPVEGIQHKYRETVLFFPSQGQTCHAYCTYCFRWAQFVNLPEMKFQSREAEDLVAYLRAHPEVTDVLITGGDPLIMKTKVLRRYVESLLTADLPNLRQIRIGTKSVAYWPQRFVSDPDADDLLHLFEEVAESGRQLALMGHYSHPVELATPVAREAVRRIRDAGAEIRVQAPLIRHVNDSARAWAELWRTAVGLGMIPYYMFVERDTGPKRYFELPLARSHRIFRAAYNRVSGLARTVRGPSMSAFPGKVRILGVEEVYGERVFVLDLIQARDPDWVRRPFFAEFDAEATWLTDLEPAFGRDRFFFEEESEGRPRKRGRALELVPAE
jgi:KamA family protein